MRISGLSSGQALGGGRVRVMARRWRTRKLGRLLQPVVRPSGRQSTAVSYILTGALWGLFFVAGAYGVAVNSASHRWFYVIMAAVLVGGSVYLEGHLIVGWSHFREDTRGLGDQSKSGVGLDALSPPSVPASPAWTAADERRHLDRLADGVATQIVAALAWNNEPAPIKQGPVMAAAIRGGILIDLMMAGVLLDGSAGVMIRDQKTDFVPAQMLVRWLQRHPRATIDHLLRRGKPTERTMMRQLQRRGWLHQNSVTRRWSLAFSAIAMTHDNLDAAFRDGRATDPTTAAVVILYAALGILGATPCETAATNPLVAHCGPAAPALAAVAQFLRKYRFEIAAAGVLDEQALFFGGGAGGSL